MADLQRSIAPKTDPVHPPLFPIAPRSPSSFQTDPAHLDELKQLLEQRGFQALATYAPTEVTRLKYQGGCLAYFQRLASWERETGEL